MPEQIKLYTYKQCGTCRKALKFLNARRIAYREIAIRETPPSTNELQAMAEAYGGDYRRLFNTSGQSYRQGGFKDKLPDMSAADKIAALAADGNLIKRPFLISAAVKLVGFNETDWQRLLAAKAG